MVGPDRLRFDFSHFEGLTVAETEEVERLVNERVLRNVGVATEILGYEAAVAKGATAFSGKNMKIRCGSFPWRKAWNSAEELMFEQPGILDYSRLSRGRHFLGGSTD